MALIKHLTLYLEREVRNLKVTFNVTIKDDDLATCRIEMREGALLVGLSQTWSDRPTQGYWWPLNLMDLMLVGGRAELEDLLNAVMDPF